MVGIAVELSREEPTGDLAKQAQSRILTMAIPTVPASVGWSPRQGSTYSNMATCYAYLLCILAMHTCYAYSLLATQAEEASAIARQKRRAATPL